MADAAEATEPTSAAPAAMTIVVPETTFSPDYTAAMVVVRDTTRPFPTAIANLDGMAARNMALAYAAQQGLTDPRINGMVGAAYAVNEDGVPVAIVTGDDGKPLPPTHPKRQPAAYQVDVPVCRGL